MGGDCRVMNTGYLGQVPQRGLCWALMSYLLGTVPLMLQRIDRCGGAQVGWTGQALPAGVAG